MIYILHVKPTAFYGGSYQVVVALMYTLLYINWVALSPLSRDKVAVVGKRRFNHREGHRRSPILS